MKKREKCKETVFSDRFVRGHQCSRYARRDGFCNQHHPDAIKARREESDRRYREEWKRESELRISRALRNATMEQLQAEIVRRTT